MSEVKTAKTGAVQAAESLERILKEGAVHTVFQPIVSLRDGSVLGYEALSRGPEQSPLHCPSALFAQARACGEIWDLEFLCRTRALEAVGRMLPNARIFLNIDPSVLCDPRFAQGFTGEYLQLYGLDPGRIHIEITENCPVKDTGAFAGIIELYKTRHFKIAVDDMGAGYSGLNLISDVRPHYLKLDRNLVSRLDTDGFKKALVRSIFDFCRTSGIALIAEGIETRGELNALVDIGVHYGQGFFLQRPSGAIRPIDGEVLECIRIRNAQRNHLCSSLISKITIGSLCRRNPTVPPEEAAENVYQMFLAEPELIGVTVVKDGGILGAVTNTRIHFRMSGQYGYSLYARRPIDRVMDGDALTVDYEVPIDIVTKLAMSRPPEKLYDFIVVSLDGRYCGIVTIRDLLEKTMEIEVSNARHQNPLSGLPGNLVIESNLIRCVLSDDPFTVLYFDLDNFKAFNDVYGFESGDNVLRFLTDILKNTVLSRGFVGHIGGDDFVAVLPFYETGELCREIIRRFDAGIRDFYEHEDLERGCISARNRQGRVEKFPLMTLSIAGVTNRAGCFQDIYQLSGRAGVLKKKCKQEWKSCFFLE